MTTEIERIVTANPPDRINFTEMYVTHDAFRRDLDRMTAAAAAGRAAAPKVLEGWKTFTRQLEVHHTVEDAWLWPKLRERLAGRPGDLRLLDEMEAEHALIDPQLAAIDTALATGSGEVAGMVGELRVALEDHLSHEEADALPLIASVMTPKDWAGFRGAMARRQRLSGAAEWIPWIIDGMPPEDARRWLRRMPPPLRLLNRLSWQARYRGRGLWDH
ncbi:hemerythrin domain-containing protein [Actinacidiphila rubida]|uniref:Hemerythrin HHE cation binding domain-containing protein n=1 Tax=Actinacidiphila rubida TaxID=310780 RepID=A0A1H8I676_9ACTN|nr:hemerythrin domain-containing protein [Actinacidiphila rubida]SEN63801.1 Hemerythrin HHE cation binding domain-containing protein [Actinacidiphila rubida]